MTAKKQDKSVSGRDYRLKAASDHGVDIPALLENINRSVFDRIRRHNIALNTAEQLREAKHK